MLTEPTWFNLLKYLHIGAGGIALLTGGATYFLRKHRNLHETIGKIYFWSMVVVAATSVAMAVYHQKWFFFMVAVFTFHLAFTAYRALFLRGLHRGESPKPWDWAAEGISAFSCLFLVGYGVYAVFHDALQVALVCFVFGGLGLRFVLSNVLRYFGRVRYKAYPQLQHVTGMLGSYAGAWTAFLVTNGDRIKVPYLVAFLLPGFLVTFLIVRERRKQRRKGYIQSLKGSGD